MCNGLLSFITSAESVPLVPRGVLTHFCSGCCFQGQNGKAVRRHSRSSWFLADVIWAGALFSANVVPNTGCFWARRFMFSGRYSGFALKRAVIESWRVLC
jgi:hypothetical protein